MGYITYGNSLFESIINSIQSPLIRQTANLLIAIHCILTLTIVINPINQDLEHMLKIPHCKLYKIKQLNEKKFLIIYF